MSLLPMRVLSERMVAGVYRPGGADSSVRDGELPDGVRVARLLVPGGRPGHRGQQHAGPQRDGRRDDDQPDDRLAAPRHRETESEPDHDATGSGAYVVTRPSRTTT